jgi:hypothetical protein
LHNTPWLGFVPIAAFLACKGASKHWWCDLVGGVANKTFAIDPFGDILLNSKASGCKEESPIRAGGEK